jgi:hypothetical protein
LTEKLKKMELILNNNDLHEFSQWFAFHYSGDGSEEYRSSYPREEIIDLVNDYIKSGSSNVGFVKWFAEKYGLYEDSDYHYQEFTTDGIINKIAATREEWINQHFEISEVKNVTNGLIEDYLKAKSNGNIFQIIYIEDLKKHVRNNRSDNW